MAKTETITFDDGSGDFWEIKTYLTQATERGFIQIGIDAQITYEDDSPEILTRLAANTNEMIALSTVSWSYDCPITSESIYNEIPAHHTAQVVERMGDLYSPLLVKSMERGLQNYLLLSKEEALSTQNG